MVKRSVSSIKKENYVSKPFLKKIDFFNFKLIFFYAFKLLCCTNNFNIFLNKKYFKKQPQLYSQTPPWHQINEIMAR